MDGWIASQPILLVGRGSGLNLCLFRPKERDKLCLTNVVMAKWRHLLFFFSDVHDCCQISLPLLAMMR